MKIKITLLVEGDDVKHFLDNPDMLKEEISDAYFGWGNEAVIDCKVEQVADNTEKL